MSATPTRKPRGFKIALIILLILFLLFVGGLFLLPYFLPVGTIKSIANSKAKDYGVAVDFKSLGFSWNGSVVLDGISVMALNDDGTTKEPLLTVDEGRANVAITPLLSGKIIVNSVGATGFTLRVVRDENGGLNIPDLSKLQAATAALPETSGSNRVMLSTARAAETPASSLPPIEVHRVELNKGVVVFEDMTQKLNLPLGIDFVRIDGGDLNSPFSLSGRLLPYPDAPDKGEFPFTGRVALVKDGAFNPDGEAALEVNVTAFSLHEIAEKLGLGEMLAAGKVDGLVKAGYAERKGAIAVSDMRLTAANLGIAPGQFINVPDTTVGMAAQFDPETGIVDFTELSLVNNITDVTGKARVEGIYEMAETGMPTAALDFSGKADFTRAAEYLTAQGMGIEGIPELEGGGNFSGRVTLPRAENASIMMAPTFALDFSDGTLGAREVNTGAVASVGLKGVGVRAGAQIGEDIAASANINLEAVPVRAVVPQLGPDPIDVVVNGGMAADMSSESLAAEIRLKDTLAKIPKTPYSGAMEIKNPEARIIFDLGKDVLNIKAMSFTINNIIEGSVSEGVMTGLMAGNPEGESVMTLRAPLDQTRELFLPLIPEIASQLKGGLRASTRVKLAAGSAEILAQAEIDEAGAVLDIQPGVSQGAVDSPKTTVGMMAAIKLEKPILVTVNTLEVKSNGATVRYVDKAGSSMAGTFGGALVKLAGVVDVDAMILHLSGLTVDMNGMNVALGQNNVQVAGLSGGLVKVQGPTPEQALLVPLSAKGDFSLPNLDVGLANMVFYRNNNGQREDSNFGNIVAKLSVDGYIGDEKRQLVNLRTARFSSNTVAAEARGQCDIGSGALVAQYGAQMAPAGMTALLGYLGLPPALLSDATVTGTLSWDGAQLSAKGESKGQLRLVSGEAAPFAAAHDLSAAYNAAEESLAVVIRRLDGNVNIAGGPAVVTLAAQPSNLLLSRAGSKGFVDIRFNGSAAPTRQLLLGMIGIFPQFREYSTMLNQAKAEGAYQAWLQIKEQGESALGLNLGGVWQGAAVSLNGAPFLAEAQRLSAALEGQFAYRDNRIDVTRMQLRSDSAVMQADGKLQVQLATDQSQNITGLGNVNIDLSFVMGDLSKVALVFPGVVPGNLGIAGRIDGAFKAAGDAHDIRVGEGTVRFQGFQARPSESLDVAIPNGAANFGAVISLVPGQGAGGPPSDFEVFRMFNIANGQAALTGAQVKGKPVNDMSSAIDLQNGVLTLRSAQLSIGGGADGSVRASGTVDFNQAVPSVNLQLAARNIPMAEANSEIEQFARIESGTVHMPAAEGQAARIAFRGLTEDDILQTLVLENFTFATSPIVLYTGPTLNAELDKARAIMKMDIKDDESRMITIKSVEGMVTAGGGAITIPHETPINVIGDNTGDFRAWGHVNADRTMRVNVAVVGKLENIMGFSLPNLIPNLRSGPAEDRNRFMAKLNENAANEHYRLRVEGTLDSPDIFGIGLLAGTMVKDVFTAAPGQIIGGVVDLGKDAPKAVLGAAGAILSAPGDVVKSPETIIRAPENALKGLGRAFGVGRDRGSSSDDSQQQEQEGDAAAPAQEGEDEQDGGQRRSLFPFGR